MEDCFDKVLTVAKFCAPLPCGIAKLKEDFACAFFLMAERVGQFPLPSIVTHWYVLVSFVSLILTGPVICRHHDFNTAHHDEVTHQAFRVPQEGS